MTTIDLTIPTDLETYFEEVGAQNDSQTTTEARMRTIAQAEVERAYFDQMQRPIASPLVFDALVTYSDGQRYITPISGGGQPIPVPWGIISGIRAEGKNFSGGFGIRPHGLTSIYGQDWDTITQRADELMMHDRGRLIEAAARVSRIEAAQKRKFDAERDEKNRRDRAEQNRRFNTCGVCGGVNGAVDERYIHNGIHAVGGSEPTITSCLDCWGRAHQAWLGTLGKRARR